MTIKNLQEQETEAWTTFTRQMGVRMARIRQAQNLTQQYVANRAGIGEYTYMRYESGRGHGTRRMNPTLSHLIAISQALNVTISELLPLDLPDMLAK